jgi:IS30 family transposase
LLCLTLYLDNKIRKLKTKNAEHVAKAIVRALKPIVHLCKSITSDNGKEFAGHEYVSKELGVDFYFTDPYAS